MKLVIRTLSRHEFPEALRLRIEVFVEEQNVPIEEEQDALDEEAVHFGAFCCGTLVGTGRLVDQPNQGKIGRMAVAKAYRGQGVGSALLQTIIDECRTRGYARAYLSAQLHAIPFYQSQGFSVTSGEYMDAGIVHKDMVKEL